MFALVATFTESHLKYYFTYYLFYAEEGAVITLDIDN